MSKLYADIIIDISHEALDKVFQYEVPQQFYNIIEVGMCVNIPFGKANRIIKGYIVNLTNIANFDVTKIKLILSISNSDIGVNEHLIKLAKWIKDSYGSTMIKSLKTVIPVKRKINHKENKFIKLLLKKDEVEDYLKVYQKRGTSRERLINELLDEEILSYDIVTKKLNINSTMIKNMQNEKAIEILSEIQYRNPIKSDIIESGYYNLTNEQQVIIDEFFDDYENDIRKTYLLYGVTGSGKTQVYIEMIDKVISMGKQAIVLIPEISLTYQTVKRFRQRFKDRVSIINSRLTDGERYDQYLRAEKGEIDIMIGPRSSIFTPFKNLGLIIIDEEHESTYKNDFPPKYHTRDVAKKRAEMLNASVVLGSATPSIESFMNVKLGKYKLFTLKERAKKSTLPDVHIVDLREELKSGNRTIFSRKLRELIIDRLEKKEQIMLFINRRGYSSFVSCRNCGYVVKCPHCDISLKYHLTSDKLLCHYCGYEIENPKICPECHSKYIARYGTGTQKVEEELKKNFPNAKILRMDMDTTKNKNSHEEILSAFSNQEADILVGTQMIVKGHDFPNVTLVGAILADLSLFDNDYMANERTFDLLTQASGRAGRGEKKGEVVIQTYKPENYSLICASMQNYDEFYEQEIAYRRLLKYPPVYSMLAIFFSGNDENFVEKATIEIFNTIKYNNIDGLKIIGTSKANIYKMNDMYRKVIYLKHRDYDVLVKIKDILEQKIEKEQKAVFKKVGVLFDFNPIGSY